MGNQVVTCSISTMLQSTLSDLGNLAYMNSNQFILNPVASATPIGVGDLVFQLTNDTTLVVKVKGSDGTVRSATLTLA